MFINSVYILNVWPAIIMLGSTAYTSCEGSKKKKKNKKSDSLDLLKYVCVILSGKDQLFIRFKLRC